MIYSANQVEIKNKISCNKLSRFKIYDLNKSVQYASKRSLTFKSSKT